MGLNDGPENAHRKYGRGLLVTVLSVPSFRIIDGRSSQNRAEECDESDMNGKYRIEEAV